MKIFIVDDHQAVREGLKTLLSNTPGIKVVGEVADGRDVIIKVRELDPDVILLDISLPDCDGFSICEEIKTTFPLKKVIFFTAHEDPGYIRDFTYSKADGYVLKRSASQEIVKSLLALKEQKPYIDGNVAGTLASQLQIKQQLLDNQKLLSEHEKNIFKMLASGLSTKEMAHSLSLSPRTVESYKAKAMRKLGFSSKSEIVDFAYKCGWLEQLNS